MSRAAKMRERKFGPFNIEDINAILLIFAAFTIILLGYLLYFLSQTAFQLLPFLTLPLIAGLVTESRRLSNDWKVLALKLMLAFVPASVIMFFYPIESIDIAEALEDWHYIFIFFFALISAVVHEKEATVKITEGITLLQSVSLLYLLLQYNYLDVSSLFERIVFGIGILFTGFSLFNAFSLHELRPKTRLMLSIWSSMIMLVFSFVYIYRVYHFHYFTGVYSIDYFINVLQYFLLGVSLLYIFQNARMLAVYVPSKNSFFDRDHLKRIARMNKLHVWRYSEEQVQIKDSAFILAITVLLYLLNYIFSFLPGLTLIWIVFWTAPIIISLKNKVIFKREISPSRIKNPRSF